MADTGLVLVGTGAHITGSGADWSAASNITVEDSSRAYSDIPKNDGLSDYLRGTNCSFPVVPSFSTIEGIEVQFEIQADGSVNDIYDEFIYLVENGSIITNCQNKALPDDDWPTSPQTRTYGGPSDTWGCSLTPAIINSPTFGVQIMAQNQDNVGAREARIFWMKIRVYYTDGTTYQAEGTSAGSSGAAIPARISRKVVCDISGSGSADATAIQVDSSDGDGSGLLLLVQHDGVMYRYGVKNQALAAQWHGTIVDVGPIKLSLPTRHGGFLQVSTGQMRFVPSTFGGVKPWSIDVWPPPKELDAMFRCKSTDKQGAAKLFEGKLYRESVSEKDVVYDVYIPSFTETIGANISLGSWSTTGSTLINFFEKVCDVLGLTLDSSKATTNPPLLSHTLSSERLVIDVASDVAAFCCHMFWIAEGILYLQDMSVSNGTLSLKNPNDFFRSPAYTDEIPVNRVVAGAHKFEGTEYPYGVDYTLLANYTGNDSQLQGIYELVNGQWAEVSVPAESGCGEFVPGKQVTLHDARLAVPSETIINMRAVSYDFIKSSVKIAGHCIMNEL
ncbi:hypothetical protein [Prosthecochloris sp. SCSIO W1103]|uniref:hypothetical protein n=1 Tax=Prosthecochloris sp. SCSIO W1103 TaxID=2992244 RepID=UPI00223E3E09|nr:hypothetical protein [Prosthecochloris sp. SCSIO W1103]UZJ37334.1 hypothetical protein OO005_11365 [Prosthecochloris sp. SCSIO W1103]